MQHIKDYTGSVYGGLGQLLLSYCETKQLPISKMLHEVQSLERFDFSVWRELLKDIDRMAQCPALGLSIAEYVQPKHLGIIAYIAQSRDTLSEALSRFSSAHL